MRRIISYEETHGSVGSLSHAGRNVVSSFGMLIDSFLYRGATRARGILSRGIGDSSPAVAQRAINRRAAHLVFSNPSFAAF